EERADPLLEDVDLAGIVWTAGDDPPGRPLVTTGRQILLAREPSGTLNLNVDLARSNLTRSAAWPILLSNLTRAARSRLPGFSARHALLGEEVHVTVPPSGRFTLTGPGLPRAALTAGELALRSLAEPGDFVLERDGRTVDTLTMFAVDAEESDLRGLATA